MEERKPQTNNGCLSPVSLAIRRLHQRRNTRTASVRGRTNVPCIIDNTFNSLFKQLSFESPLQTGRATYSPPASRQGKRKRPRSLERAFDCGYGGYDGPDLLAAEREEFFRASQMQVDPMPTAKRPRRTSLKRSADAMDMSDGEGSKSLTRSRSVESTYQPRSKMRKLAHDETQESDIVVGGVVRLRRRNGDVMNEGSVLARVICKEPFGILVSVASESEDCPRWKAGQRFWAKFSGATTLQGLVIVDFMHAANEITGQEKQNLMTNT